MKAFQLRVIFECKVKALLFGAPLRAVLQPCPQPLDQAVRFAGDEHSSLFESSFSDDEKRSFSIITTCQCYKTFYGCNLQIAKLDKSISSLCLAYNLGHEPTPERNICYLAHLSISTIKSCIPLTSKAQCYKTFDVHNLLMFIISLNVCPCRAFPAWSNACEQALSLPE